MRIDSGKAHAEPLGWLQRLRSLRHAFGYRLSESLRWSRGEHREAPALALSDVEDARVQALREGYGVRFETHRSAATSRRNYEYLELLDLGWAAAGMLRPRNATLVDVGCASFWYAAALAAFFEPRRMTGVEIEGYRLFRDGRARIDYARGYVADLPGADFLVGDYTRMELRAELITAWFPFLTAGAVPAWRLPLSLLAPKAGCSSAFDIIWPSGDSSSW